MYFPAERELRAERARFMATIESLTDAEFESGPTLCAGWAPRDVLAHLISTDQPGRYVRNGLRIDATNADVVRGARGLSRTALTEAGSAWAANPSTIARVSAGFLLGDVAVHHQDVLRALGRARAVPAPVAAAIFREGVILSAALNRRLLRNRVVPTTPGGRPLGRGPEVRGTAEALGMWLAGRDSVTDELSFAAV
jgi:uncharacterized protein (TIGR03083 family)